MEYKDRCRVCLEDGDMKSLFMTNCMTHLQISCAQAIANISSVIVKEGDGLPQRICKRCLRNLKIAYKFKVLCEDSNAILLNNIKLKIEIEDNESSNEKRNISAEDDAGETCNQFNNDNRNCIPTDKLVENDINAYSKNTNHSDSDENVNAKFNANESLQKRKKYRARESERKHKKLHSKEKEFQCEICSKVFLRSATLRIHLLAHRDELPFRCSHPGCDKAFALNSRLRLHLKVHTDERNFICQYCSHAARDKQQLNVHIRYFHTKEKNFLCGECGKAFVSTQARYYHAKRHENVRNHHCPHCDKSFVFAFGLRGHLATHTGEKRFGCSICDAKFSRKEHKEKHESRLHGIDKIPMRRLKAISPPLPIQNLQ